MNNILYIPPIGNYEVEILSTHENELPFIEQTYRAAFRTAIAIGPSHTWIDLTAGKGNAEGLCLQQFKLNPVIRQVMISPHKFMDFVAEAITYIDLATKTENILKLGGYWREKNLTYYPIPIIFRNTETEMTYDLTGIREIQITHA